MQNNELLKRVAVLDKIVITHPAFDAAVQGVNDCVLKSQAYREPVGCLLLAEGGLGKSTVCRTILAKMKTYKRNEALVQRTIMPAFYTEIPSPATVKSVAASMLNEMGAVSPYSGLCVKITERLCTLLAAAETKLVFLDETQNLFRQGIKSTKFNADVCTWIKWMVNRTKVSFCLVGLPDFGAHLSADSQLTRRFPMHFNLLPLSPGDISAPGSLIPFLNEAMRSSAKLLEFREVPNLSNLFSATQVYAATGGNPSFIMSFIKEAALHAYRRESDRLTLDDFSTAWESRVTSTASLTKANPFQMSSGTLAGALRSTM